LKFHAGKIPNHILKEIVFEHLGAKREDVILGPSIGEDGALMNVGDKVLVSSMDPITGAVNRIGWLAVNICANDIATFGVQPLFFSSCILLPEDSNTTDVQIVSDQIGKAAKKLGIAVVGGHSEVTPGIKHPIVVGHSIGITEKGRYVTSGGAKPGDQLILTKVVGIEGTAILASDRRKVLMPLLGNIALKAAEAFFNHISVVTEAVSAFETGGVTAMHDPTEGGVAGGIHELAAASGVGVKVIEEKMPIAPETLRICEFFKIDPLQLISSGALLISAKANSTDKVLERLASNNVKASVIGEVSPSPEDRIFIRNDGSTWHA
jgi:hydrogenase expression/formation protein HypE